MTELPEAIVLAAGAGRRIGRPKALLELDGTTYLARIVATCRTAGCSRVWVAARPDCPDVLNLIDGLRSEGFSVTTVLNPDPERGMFSSVRAVLVEALAVDSGFASRGAPNTLAAELFVLFPVDHPWVTAETVTSLLETATRTGAAWIRPTFEGQGGHPIVIRRAVAAELLRQDPRTPLRSALRAAGAEPVSVSVADAGVLRNVNRPEDLR